MMRGQKSVDLKHIYTNYFQNIFNTKKYRDAGARYSVFFPLPLLWSILKLPTQHSPMQYAQNPIKRNFHLPNLKQWAKFTKLFSFILKRKHKLTEISVIWDITQRRVVIHYRRFGTTYRVPSSRIKKSKRNFEGRRLTFGGPRVAYRRST